MYISPLRAVQQVYSLYYAVSTTSTDPSSAFQRTIL